MTPQQRVDFILANTAILPVPLVPEIKLHLAHEAVPLWQKTEEELGEIGLPPPFWAFAWAGGQALARYVLDNPAVVNEKSVVDLASGSGLVAIAAMKAGAASVLAADIDEFATASMELNAIVNSVVLKTTSSDLLQSPPPVAHTILVGDLFYEKSLAEKVSQLADPRKIPRQHSSNRRPRPQLFAKRQTHQTCRIQRARHPRFGRCRNQADCGVGVNSNLRGRN